MAKKSSSNPIVLRADANIGNSAAEADDEFLFRCFVDHPALSIMADTASAKLFLSGRTGTGKTAIISMIKRNNKNSSEIDLADLALGYVANSDFIQFLNALGVDLDIFFQALWKHVFCIEYIRLRYGVKNATESKSFFQSVTNFFDRDERRATALKYLSAWEGKFWITMDENIKEITQKIETSIDTELSGEVEKFKARAGYARSLSSEKRSSLVARAKKVINSSLLAELSKVLDLLAEFEPSNKYNESYYILVDKIDEKWVDDSIRYQLIRALIECLRSFRKISDLKTIVSIRSDVLERVVQESNHPGFQREKYDDYFFRLKWDKSQLWKLVNKRINFLFRKKYSSESVFFNDVFDKKVGNKDSFDYMLERTLMRPRDIISYVNLCLSAAEGKSKVTQSIIRKAESEYSRVRLQALIEEWESAYPSLRIAFDIISRKGSDFYPQYLLSKEFIEDFMLEVDDQPAAHLDPIAHDVLKAISMKGDATEKVVTGHLISELYRIGAVSLKTSATEPFQHSHKDVPVIKASAISKDTKIKIHPMLHIALNINSS